MDKQSLSRFGAIVAVVLVLGIMIAFATPFGSFVVNSVKDALFGFNSTAIDKITNPDVDVSIGGGTKGETEDIDYAALAPGLYQTGSNYTVLLKTWDELINEGILNSTGSGVPSAQRTNVVGDLVLGNSVTTINLFSVCTELTSIVIPSSATNVISGAFQNCSNLQRIILPANITFTGQNTFDGCKNLKEVYYAGTLEQWCQTNFEWWNSNPCCNQADLYIEGVKQTNIVIPNTISTIKNETFYKCASLTEVTIHNGVTSIGRRAFSGCSNLTSIVFEGTTAEWQAITFGSDWNFWMPSNYIITCTDGTINRAGTVTPNS